ncbi:hypothetical protein [Pseudomonas sp. H1h]|uniref:hypothetical protein n=1 Tax=Pseudomonas sp. H1h TaxID=1397280 RepID=UPI00046AA598|nr:hypothetical protein [Pseudomonas sp. H1h]
MFNKYPEQKESRRVFGALGAAFLVLGIFLIAIEGTGGVLFTVMGSVLMLLVLLSNEKTYAKVLRVLGWFDGLS